MKGGRVLNDKQLLKLIHSDPVEGLSESINLYSGILTAVVMRILKNQQEAEECVADTFYEASRARERNFYT